MTDLEIRQRVNEVRAAFRAQHGALEVRHFEPLDAYGLAGQGHWYTLSWYDALTDDERAAYDAMCAAIPNVYDRPGEDDVRRVLGDELAARVLAAPGRRAELSESEVTSC